MFYFVLNAEETTCVAKFSVCSDFSFALKEIPEDDEHLPINIEIEKRQSTKVEPKKSLYRSNFVLQDDSGPQTPFPL